MVHVTAGMVRVTNPVTPARERNPTPRTASGPPRRRRRAACWGTSAGAPRRPSRTGARSNHPVRWPSGTPRSSRRSPRRGRPPRGPARTSRGGGTRRRGGTACSRWRRTRPRARSWCTRQTVGLPALLSTSLYSQNTCSVCNFTTKTTLQLMTARIVRSV
jgi:hypothetical protein